ncbi:hypothetical protein D3C87_449970 [compost metagenome]
MRGCASFGHRAIHAWRGSTQAWRWRWGAGARRCACAGVGGSGTRRSTPCVDALRSGTALSTRGVDLRRLGGADGARGYVDFLAAAWRLGNSVIHAMRGCCSFGHRAIHAWRGSTQDWWWRLGAAARRCACAGVGGLGTRRSTPCVDALRSGTALSTRGVDLRRLGRADGAWVHVDFLAAAWRFGNSLIHAMRGCVSFGHRVIHAWRGSTQAWRWRWGVGTRQSACAGVGGSETRRSTPCVDAVRSGAAPATHGVGPPICDQSSSGGVADSG